METQEGSLKQVNKILSRGKLYIKPNIQKVIDDISSMFIKIISSKTSKLEKLKLENDYLNRKIGKLESRMFVDSLTRITNRGKFDILLKKLFKNGKDFSLLFFDIDHFKEVNDTCGHLSGDLVLKKVASEIKKVIKSRDIFARYGGEEFIIILPKTNIGGGKAFSERIREFIEKLDIIDNEGRKINITISVGVVERKNKDNVDSILKRADEALYVAKDGGRNRVECG